MKAQELIQALQKLPPNAEIYLRPAGESTTRQAINGLELRLPPTIALDRPGLGWADSISDSITGEIVGERLVAQRVKETASAGQ